MGMQIKQKREMKWKAEQLEELEKIFEQWEIFLLVKSDAGKIYILTYF